MKHTEQLQSRSPVQPVGTLPIQNRSDEKEQNGRKCYGGRDSGDGKN
jgi:hypothetical protein